MPELVVATPSGNVDVHLQTPATIPAPGLLVLHEVFGLNDDIRQHVKRLSGQGYLAVAPDLYSWGPKLRCVRATMSSMTRGSGPAFDILDALRGWLGERADCTGRVGVIGFCMGGGFALIAAPKYDFAAAAVNYGRVPKNAAEVLAGSCPIVGSFGADDKSLRGHAQRLETALTTLGVDHDVKEYAGAGHSFLNRHTGALTVLDKVLSSGFEGPAAADSWKRITAFFDAHLREDRS